MIVGFAGTCFVLTGCRLASACRPPRLEQHPVPHTQKHSPTLDTEDDHLPALLLPPHHLSMQIDTNKPLTGEAVMRGAYFNAGSRDIGPDPNYKPINHRALQEEATKH